MPPDSYLTQVDAEGRPIPPTGPPQGPGPATPLEAARQSMAPHNFGKLQGGTAEEVVGGHLLATMQGSGWPVDDDMASTVWMNEHI